MTDTTELAQSLKAAAEKWSVADEKYDRAEINVAEFVSAADQYNSIVRDPANILALVETLEKAQQVDEELCKLLPPGVEYMDPPDGGDVTPLEGVRRMVADYRQRIASLEESHAQVIQSRDHYKRMSEEGLKHLAESRIVTVKLPRPGFVTISGERTAVYLKADVDAAMLAAGIEETE
ncbi:ead/Ea22-like family protein [Klebsiella pneumoniae]|uniref:ead/Ea22-like family protein n=1 Tax=Klebsiella pneumoniae TaxID=573 RepID=UPI00227246FE|nr:ead/Ea22-like family protein [Klebsiella pneumoniae]ELC9132537.1 ead/Ea22-like family protein [Klebsiella pneumoniae]MDW1240493.1 ead/Ea22-like family protein [Klebsiella pneumoniae]HCM6797775.1 ead/Ea22-like family protein [Klebsiella pneumoniae]